MLLTGPDACLRCGPRCSDRRSSSAGRGCVAPCVRTTPRVACTPHARFHRSQPAPSSPIAFCVSTTTHKRDPGPNLACAGPYVRSYALPSIYTKPRNLDFRPPRAARRAAGGGAAKCGCVLSNVYVTAGPSGDGRGHGRDVQRAAGNAIFRVFCGLPAGGRARGVRPPRGLASVRLVGAVCGRTAQQLRDRREHVRCALTRLIVPSPLHTASRHGTLRCTPGTPSLKRGTLPNASVHAPRRGLRRAQALASTG